MNSLKENDVVYFPGLNGIRAIAALIVMIFHTDQWIQYFGIDSLGIWETKMQSYAVILFFVLSGYLITFLLLKEKQKTHNINLKKFYIRRILRIWPVYYVTLGIGILLLLSFPAYSTDPPNNIAMSLFTYTFLLSNFGFLLGFGHSLIGILWSVGVEEQFYAFWPLLLKTVKRSFIAISVFLAVYLLVKYFMMRFAIGVFGLTASSFFSVIPFDCMAIGALSAYLVYTKSKALKVIYHPVVQIASWIFLGVSVFYYPVQIYFLHFLNNDYHAIVYSLIIINVSTNPKTIITLENKLLNFLGRISYGIYAYHLIVLFLLSLFLKPIISKMPPVFNNIAVMIIETVVVVGVAAISMKYFEQYFISRKKKFMLIQSSNSTSIPGESN